MAWPSQALSLQKGYDRAANQIDSINRIAQNNRAAMAAGPVTAPYIFALAQNLIGTWRVLDEVSKLAGIDAYISTQEHGGRTEAEVTKDFADIKTALMAAFAEITTKAPTDADGYLLTTRLNPDFTTTDREFDVATTETLRGLLDALVALID